MKIAECIRQTLVRNGRTVGMVAKQLGMSRPNTSNVLRGRANITIKMALKMQEVYGLDADAILHRQLDEQIAAERQQRDASS